MRFPMPHHPCEFEIPDDWLREAGAIGFTPITTSYRSRPGTALAPLTAIEPVPCPRRRRRRLLARHGRQRLPRLYHDSTYGGYYHGTATNGYGAWHTGAYGAYYHQPAVVNTYAAGCWSCGDAGWGYAGAAAAGAAVGAAATAAAVAASTWSVGATFAVLPAGCVYHRLILRAFYQCPAGWLKPAYGANGLYYTVVPAPM